MFNSSRYEDNKSSMKRKRKDYNPNETHKILTILIKWIIEKLRFGLHCVSEASLQTKSTHLLVLVLFVTRHILGILHLRFNFSSVHFHTVSYDNHHDVPATGNMHYSFPTLQGFHTVTPLLSSKTIVNNVQFGKNVNYLYLPQGLDMWHCFYQVRQT